MMIDNDQGGDGPSVKRGMKRTGSPDRCEKLFGRRLKTSKFPFQSDKENQFKRCQSDMILTRSIYNKVESVSVPWFRNHSLWNHLITRTSDERYHCHEDFLTVHPTITTKMRSILFDWLIEVCEVYHLHRETYHLAIAYIDQYLCRTNNLAKQKFQLLGITALFVAAKIEEIYPPRLDDFTYVTDNTCSEEDILQMELELMNTLNWYISPITSISWLLIFLQVQYEFEQTLMKQNPLKKRRISLLNLVKEYSSSSSTIDILRSSILTDVHRSKDFLDLFSNATRLLDLCSLDLHYCQFRKDILAATAILAHQPDWPVEQLTGLTDKDLFNCRQWMKPFHQILDKSKSTHSLKSSVNVPNEEIYSIQIHNISIDLLDNVYEIRPKFVAHRPFQNMINQISWFPSLTNTSIYEEENSIPQLMIRG